MEKVYYTIGLRVTFIFLLLTLINKQSFSQNGQVAISRVDNMPNLPSPYLMRDWKDVAKKYDALIYSTTTTGQYLPFIHVKTGGVNYPSIDPIYLDTYVGSSNTGNQAEAINIIPSMVSGSLMGIDKSNQGGVNWVAKANEFFNKANGQQVFLNGYSSTSGYDWWYDVMPNVFFYQLYSQYPATTNFNSQFTTVADRWLAAVYAMGGSSTPWTLPQMDHRGWYLSSMTPNDESVHEPESAGSIGWLLYHAFLKTGNKKYLEGAEMSIEYLAGLTTSPAYELQLPYGTFVAAKMNAELGTQYDIEKMLNWSFNKGPLRNWGTIVGTWNGSDVSGLIGEANDAGNDYAFALNGFQQAAALVPLVKYDKRFARAIGKWTLNLANASRLYYSKYLPQTDQDDYAWSSVNDPESVIAYEALKQSINGKKLYGTGDAKRGGWAQTNFGLYGSSSVGYLAAVVETTDVDGILLMNLNKTDFFGKNTFPSYLTYNPYNAAKQITLPLGAQSYDVYDAISESIIKTNATGNTLITIPANEAMILTYLPQGSAPVVKNQKMYVNNDVIDYHVGYNFQGKLRIKSLSADTLVEFDQQVPVYATIENATGAVTYNWYVDGVLSTSSSAIDFNWTVPEEEGVYKILLEVINGTASAKDSVSLKVVASIPTPPVIDGFTTNSSWYYTGTSATIICRAQNKKGGELIYNFSVDGGTLSNQQDSLIHWTVPQGEGFFKITCEVKNEDNLKVSSSQRVLIKSMATGVTPPVAYYPLDGNVKDYSGNGYNATLTGAQLTTDEQNLPDRAYAFSDGGDIIFVPNQSALNFQNQITLSFWVKVDALTEESFIVSHGSWEERWKVSITPDKKLRWTVKTFGGTLDLDNSQPIVLNTFYHVAVVYTGYSMELYVDGVLDTFVPNTGLMSTTSKDITFGRKDGTVKKYALKGTLDEVRLYDKALAPDEIATLKSRWNTVTGLSLEQTINVYPNPSHGTLIITGVSKPVVAVEVTDVAGRKLNSTYSNSTRDKILVEYESSPGIAIIRIETGTTVIYKKIMTF